MAEQTRRYQYSARSSDGNMVSGVITADSETTAAKRLQRMGLSPLSIRSARVTSTKAKEPKTNRRFGRTRRVKAKDLALFARQFATLSEASLPLVRILNALAAQTTHPVLKATLAEIRVSVESGASLSTAFSKHPQVFPDLMVGLIRAGETSGSVPTAMKQVAINFEKDARLRAKVFAASLYPIVVLTMALLIVAGMLIVIVPKFAKIFAQLGGSLPLLTRMLITASHAMVFVGPMTVVGAIAFSVWWRKNKSTPEVRKVWDPFRLRIPVMGKMVAKIAIARFCRSLATLLTSGVGILQALEVVAATSGNWVVANALNAVKAAVREGRPISSAMEEHAIFPPMVTQMIATGEDSGTLPEMLTKAAEFYEQEVETSADALAGVLEPILMMVLAFVIGLMVVALYLPMLTMSNLVH